jgi:hypothetical protein
MPFDVASGQAALDLGPEEARDTATARSTT